MSEPTIGDDVLEAVGKAQKDDGGPAFPVVLPNNNSDGKPYWFEGMTLRDWFAGQALIGALAAMANPKCNLLAGVEWGKMSSECYKAADAMLAQRKK